MSNIMCNAVVILLSATLVYGKPQSLDNAAIIVEASEDASAYIEGTGRDLFPVGISSPDKAGFRLPIAELIPEEHLTETRNPRLINGPPPAEKANEDDLAIVIVGSTNSEDITGEGRVFPLDDGRRSPLVVDFEIIGAATQDGDGDGDEDFVVVQAVYDECFEGLDAGTGEDAIDSYYYDANENRCFFFWFTGTGGNGNRFSTAEECEKRCKSSGSSNRVCSTAAPICEEGCPLIKDASDGCLRCSCDRVNPEVCKEAGGKPGICKGTFPYWYFKQETQTCEPFVYGGCEAGSSSNKFKTKALCQKTCSKPQGSVEEVVLPKNLELSEQNNENSNKSNICLEDGGKRGVCNGALTFWYFKQDTKACESFIYGGCEAGSSQNKFVTKELCEQICS